MLTRLARLLAWKGRAAAVVGMLTALVFAELLLRPMVRGLVDRPTPSDGFVPSNEAPRSVKESRQFIEGVAVSHFGDDGARLTGQPWIDGAPVGVILGDLYVESLQVNDVSTVGAVVERLARTSQTALNVRQYGWSSAGLPTYVALSSRVRSALRPEWVVVVLNPGDLSTSELHADGFYRAALNAGQDDLTPIARTSVRLAPTLSRVGLTPRDLTRLLEVSSLGFLGAQRFELFLEQSPPPAIGRPREQPASPSASDDSASRSLQALREAYGDLLTIAFVPQVGVTSGDVPGAPERALMEECGIAGIRCFSLRPAMLEERNVHHQLAEGFDNTQPGSGHLNQLGHQLLGAEIWRRVGRTGPAHD